MRAPILQEDFNGSEASNSLKSSRQRLRNRRENMPDLQCRAESDKLKSWAGDLARSTQDVVAVANRMDVTDPPIWDWGPTWSELKGLWRNFLLSLPLLFLGLFILGLSWGAGLLAARKSRSVLRHRIQARLLRNVLAGGIGVAVFLIGTYIVLRVSGLTQLALTVVGGHRFGRSGRGYSLSRYHREFPGQYFS